MSAIPAKLNPFPGLRPFTQEEDYLFFGREEQTLELLQRLGSNRFVAVVGTSGSGKSSLVRCGLLSELLGGRMLGAGSAWEIAVTHPGGNPLALLTDSLLEADLYDRQEEHARENLLATLSRSHFGLVEAVKQAELGEGTNFLLVVDQFEEIFRFQDAGQRQQEVANEFISLLLEAVAQKEVPIYVVLTMRSDFIGECGQFEGLAEMVNRGEFLIPRLTREQYKRVIEGPIKVAGGQIAPRLLQRLLNDLGQQADQLPCLQHALMRTWEVGAASGDSQALDLEDYQRIGRMAEALSLHADEIYESLASDRQRELCRGLFQALTVEESNNRGIRRPQRLGRLCEILEVPAVELLPIIEAYRQSGVTFLMPSPEVELVESTIIDISHESLMRVWTRLRQWVEEETQAAGIYHRLAESAALHELGKAGLYRDPELGIALAWREAKRPNAAWAERYRPGFAAAMTFLEASQQASVAEEQAREAARQRELAQAQQLAEAERQRATDQARAAVRLRWMVRGLGLVAMVALMATAFAWMARQEARSNAKIAVQKAADADAQRQISQILLTDVAAAKELAERNLRTAELSQAEAQQAEQRSREFRYSTDVQLAATLVADRTANASQIMARLSDHDPDSNSELKGKEDLRGFEWHYLKRMVEDRAMIFEGFEKEVVAVAMSPAGELVTLDGEGRLQHFNSATGQESRAAVDLKKGRTIGSSALSHDGLRVALAIGDKVHLVDVATGEEAPRPIPAGARNGLLFSPDGKMVITVDSGLGWWDATTGNPVAVEDFALTVFPQRLKAVSVSDDGLTVAVGGQGPTGGLFSVFRMEPPARGITRLLNNVGDQGTKRALAISPDGKTIAVSLYFAGSIYLYDATTGKPLLVNNSAHPASVTAISFSPDSTKMVTAAMDGSVKVWADYKQLDTTEATSLVGHAEQVDTLGWVAAGKQVVSTGKDKSVRLWNGEQDAKSLHRTLSSAPSSGAKYSPDGTLMAISGETGAIQLRDGQTGEVVASFPRDDSEMGSDSVAFSPDNRLLAAGFGGKQDVSFIELWDIDRRELLAILPGSTDIPGFATSEQSGIVSGLAFSPDGKHLVASFGSVQMLSGGNRGNHPLLVYDVASRRTVRRLEGPGNTSPSVAFSADGTQLASACYDGTARIWDTASWRQSHILDNPDQASERGDRRVMDIAFSPDGRLLAMASAEGNVILWEVKTGTHLQTLKGHANEVGSVAFSPDGRTLASGSMDGTIRLWNTATWRELMRLEPGTRFSPRSLRFSPGGDRLLAADGIAGVLEWSIRPAGSVSESMGESLAKDWHPGIEMKNRIRMLSENLRLHEMLAGMASKMPEDQTAAAAAAATAANWQASAELWEEAVEQFDRLQQIDPQTPDTWLRMPGLLRVATALFYQHRPADAASLLAGGEKRRAQDGNGKRSVGLGIEYTSGGKEPSKLNRVYRGSPAWRAGMRAGDRLLQFNDVEFTPQTRSDFFTLMRQGAGTQVKLTIQHLGQAAPLTVQPTVASFINDDVTVETIEALLALVDQQLVQSPSDAGLHELRAELMGLSSDYEQQVISYTAAIESLAGSGEERAAADLVRLHGRRGNAYVGLKRWQLAQEDFAKGITAETSDEAVLSNKALALGNILLGPLQWTVLKPVEIKSERGATLTIQADGSILASGANVDGDVYTLTTAAHLGRIGAIRLEVLPDPNLPGGGPGRHPSGNFHLRKFVLSQSTKESGDSVKILPIGRAWASFAYQAGNADIAGTIEKNSDNFWHVWGRTGQPHAAVFQLVDPLDDSDQSLVVQLSQFHPLGRLRLSYSDTPDAISRQERYLAAPTFTDPWTRLAEAYRRDGDRQALHDLVRRHPEQAGPIGDLLIQDDKNAAGSVKDWQGAVEIYRLGITADNRDAQLLSRRARAYEALQDWKAAAADWSRAADPAPAGAKVLIEFAARLSIAGQAELAGLQRARAREILEAILQADSADAPAIDSLASLLLDISESADSGWTALRPAELDTAGSNSVALQADGSFLVTASDSGSLFLPELPATAKAIRVETASAAGADGSAVPAFKDYRIEAVDASRAPSGGFIGRYVRLDLPGDNAQYPRHAGDKNLKYINLAELQVFQGDKNISLGKNASADGGSGRLAPAGAVDGNTVGNDDGNPYAHSADTQAPWWEVDLGGEQTIDRMVVWNRSDVGLYGRMNHFRVSILDASRTVIFEQVIDEAPKPSREISCERLLVANKPAADVGSPQWALRVGNAAGAAAGKRFRVSSSEKWDSLKQNQAIVESRKIVQPLARLAAAYDLNSAPSSSADWFRLALNDVKNSSERKLVLTLLQDHLQPLAELLKQQPDDIDLQLALARSQLKEGQQLLTRKQAAVALPKLLQAQEVFSKLLAEHPEPKWTVLTPTEAVSKGGATLTVQDDGSILASGENPELDRYTLTLDVPLGTISALRIEAIPDPSMMDGGVGRGGGGSVALSNVSLTLLQDDEPERVSANFDTAIADIGDANSATDQSDSTTWAVYPDYAKPHQLALRLSESLRLRNKAQVMIGLEFFNQQYRTHGLGRFRLSVATEPMDARRFQLLDLRDAELATLDVALGIALAQQGKPAEAAAAFVRALERVDDEAEHKKLIEPMQDHSQALAIVAEQRPQDLQIQLAVAKHLAERGKSALAENRQEEALTELARARDIFSRLVEQHPEPKWTVLRPTQMTSDGGADLALEADGSIFVSGTNPDRATYSISVPLSGDRITALRLETIPDARLPEGGAGRAGNGNFHVAEFSATIASDGENGQPTPIAFSSVIADMGSATNMIDGNPGTRWDTIPKIVEAHSAILALKSPTQTAGGVMTVTLDSGISEWVKHGLGRIRLSATTGSNVIASARFHQELQVIGLLDLELALGNAYGQSRRLDEAATAFHLALNLATQHDARSKILQAAAMHEGLLDKLKELRSADAAFHDALARHHQANGKPEAARAATATARTIYEQQLAADHGNSQVAGELADLLFESRSARWIPLQPEELKSAGGADLKLLGDNSILASGINPDRDVYTIVARPDLERITGFRLEALPDDTLPLKGPGRAPDFGNFHLNELSVWSEGVPVTLTDIATLHDGSGLASQMIDGRVDAAQGWSNYPKWGQANAAYIATDLQRNSGSTLKFELHFSTAQWTQHNLGRFRLSATDTPSPLGYEQKFLATKTILSPWARLGAAYHGVAEFDRALEMFARSIETASGLAARSTAAQQAAAFEDTFSRLLERFPDDPSLRLGQAKFLTAQHISNNEFQLAADVLSSALAEFPNDLELLNQRAAAWMKLAQWQSADADYARVIELEGEDGRRRAAQRARAEALVQMGQFQAGAEVRLQEMMRSSELDGMRDAYSAALLAGNPPVARMVAKRFFRTVSRKQDLDAYWSAELVRLHTALPGMVTQDNQQRLLEAATKAGGEWVVPYTAAIHYRLGALEKAQPLLDVSIKDREFQSLAAMLLVDQGESARAAEFLAQSERWLRQQSQTDSRSVIPAQARWDIWTVSQTVRHEAARKLIGPRIAELDELLAKEPDKRAELLERAEALAQVGLYEEALSDLQRLGTLKVDSPASLALHGRILAGLGRDQEALPLLNRAIERGLADGAAHAARGAVLLRQQRIDAAREDLEKSLSLKPNELAAGALADLLLTEAASATRWTVLEPTKVTSEGGATLAVLDDHSILASGKNPLGDAYRIVAPCGPGLVSVIRLEALTDESLPNQGPGRDEQRDRGNFDMVDWEIRYRDADDQSIRMLPSRATADYSASHVPIGPTRWNIGGGASKPHTALFLVENPATFTRRGQLAFRLQFSSDADWPKQNLGRFRLAVASDPAAFEREKKRLAALQATNPWFRLHLAYQLHGKNAESDALVETHPDILRAVADDQFDHADWEGAIAGYSKLIGDKTSDTSLLVKRGEAYFATKRFDLARADWRRAVELAPELAQTQFDRLRQAGRRGEAGEFGLKLIEQNPEDTMLWIRAAPMLAVSEDPNVYTEFCSRMLQRFAASEVPETAERLVKVLVLRVNSSDLPQGPVDLMVKSLDDGTGPDWFPPWAWGTRALLAYRRGEAESAVKYVAKSEEHNPAAPAHAVNLALLAMAQHQLQYLDQARLALDEASQTIARLKADPALKGDHDLLIAEILLHEAEALLTGKEQPKGTGTEEK